MKRTQLRFQSLHQIAGSSEMSVILLTDMDRQRALSVVCDELMTRELLLRLHDNPMCQNMLPESLLQFLPSEYEMMVVGVYDGQYQVMLMDVLSGKTVRIRMSDAVLLMILSRVPLYIEEGLMQRQCVPFEADSTGVTIPINTMDVERLRQVLTNAVNEENYELASQIRDEIKRRSHQKV